MTRKTSKQEENDLECIIQAVSANFAVVLRPLNQVSIFFEVDVQILILKWIFTESRTRQYQTLEQKQRGFC